MQTAPAARRSESATREEIMVDGFSGFHSLMDSYHRYAVLFGYFAFPWVITHG